MQTFAANRPILPSWRLAGAALCLLTLAAMAAPVWLYSTSLAVFGGMHVLSELRYVELRFGTRLRSLWVPVAVLLAGLVLLRASAAAHIWPRDILQLRLEHLGVIGLALVCMPRLFRSGLRPTLVGGMVVAIVGWGLVERPVLTAFVLSALHNWTPVGFLAEALPGGERRKGLVLGVLGFGVIPLMLMLGWGQAALQGGLGPLLELPRLLPELLSGSVSDQVAGWPRTIRQELDAPALFGALAFAQCMHYLAVIGLMPRICPEPARPAQAWLLGRIAAPHFWMMTVGLSGVLLVGFGLDFELSRQWYFVPATLHAWIELPALLLALTPRGESDSESGLAVDH